LSLKWYFIFKNKSHKTNINKIYHYSHELFLYQEIKNKQTNKQKTYELMSQMIPSNSTRKTDKSMECFVRKSNVFIFSVKSKDMIINSFYRIYKTTNIKREQCTLQSWEIFLNIKLMRTLRAQCLSWIADIPPPYWKVYQLNTCQLHYQIFNLFYFSSELNQI
jgi:hypothetical protein